MEALARALDASCHGRTVTRIELASFSALKTVRPRLEDLRGRRVLTCGRRGKFLLLELEPDWLVLHLARAGWVHWREPLPSARLRPGRNPTALRLGLRPEEAGGPAVGFDVTEAGTESRLALWAVSDPDAIPQLRELGPEPLSLSFDLAYLGRTLTRAGGTVKRALTDQRLVAGIGNAYSDEILHRARLSPFRPARRLHPEEVAALHQAITAVLGAAVAQAVALTPEQLKRSKHQAMAVHGRTGQPCPVCGDTVREVAYATRTFQYCPTCQTRGRPLADRRLSRLLK